ncbi:MAG: sigma-70 family RNA polymerase sigma factor [Clostridia bacterium]|jgi:transposase|nr:sigma-70 family RNA polymerase sigma factor [Clostridia bacterium]
MRMEIRGVEKLSFRERQVVALKETGKTSEQIAKQLGLSASTVATLYNRARTKGYEVVIIVPGEALGLFGTEVEEEA